MMLLLSWIPTLGILAAPTSSSIQSIRVTLREPAARTYQIVLGTGFNLPVTATTSTNLSALLAVDWILAEPMDHSGPPREWGRRLFVSLQPGFNIQTLLQNKDLFSTLTLQGEVQPGTWVLQAPDAWTALEAAQRIGTLPGVVSSYPIPRFPLKLNGAYAPAPSDPYFPQQWHLENRDTNGLRLGIDLDVRSAWSTTRGTNVHVAIVDDGVEMNHPDLFDRFFGNPHFNFGDNTTNAGPSLTTAAHSTAVSGLLGATANNQRGVSGVAPAVNMASWVIFRGTFLTPDTLGLKAMFEFQPGWVDVQNHSWGAGGNSLYPLPPFESMGISNAVTLGRGGKGTILVRAGNNFRTTQADANADGYASDPRVIAVAAVRSDGRVTRYSNVGACLLVGAPSAESQEGSTALDLNFPSLVTTDLPGSAGRNTVITSTDSADYRFDSTGFTGTSGSTPLISGIVALMLQANTNLTYRDVQQALLLSSIHRDPGDPDIRTNGAGLLVSHNVGFGVPLAGLAAQRAAAWISRPPLQIITCSVTNAIAIPDDGLTLEVTGDNIPPEIAVIHASPTTGPHPKTFPAPLAAASVGLADSSLKPIPGQIGIAQRGGNTFADKLTRMQSAGASLGILYNNQGLNERLAVSGADFLRMPGVFIGRASGEILNGVITTNPSARVQIQLRQATQTLQVTNTLICEHVGLRVRTDHTRRGDLRITLYSPAGTPSVMQRVNADGSAGPDDWTYYSVQHFFESTAGTWTVEVLDEETGNTGSILQLDLILRGTPIVDSDRDGLADSWELDHFGNLSSAGNEDPDGDQLSNAVEQILGSNPLLQEIPFLTDISRWNPRRLRLSWPSVSGTAYQILGSSNPEGPFEVITTVPGTFPETEWVAPSTNTLPVFFKIQTTEP